MEEMNNFFNFIILQLLFTIQNVLQNLNIFNRSRETVLSMPFICFFHLKSENPLLSKKVNK